MGLCFVGVPAVDSQVQVTQKTLDRVNCRGGVIRSLVDLGRDFGKACQDGGKILFGYGVSPLSGAGQAPNGSISDFDRT